ncbi:hypothetical protein PLESTB_001168300 [Pleodorina starrii]|uniref:Flavin-containing monooxygenase n=1 Tax=Pleodorina starrii TaxID=330485 RepID=A0A9W6BRM3_9CHLO|nr:hypothetical protein PLESTB_001168300 [Pleodorina starrii]
MSSHSSAGAPRLSRRVAVIGAGAAGLVAARELRSEGHDVTVLEQSPYVGGVWRYDPRTEAEDLLGVNPDRCRVHGSMYEKLRTNLPRELMSFLDFPFDSAFLGPNYSSDPRRFCGHAEVLGYLDAFADRFELRPLVRTHTRVLSVETAAEAAQAEAGAQPTPAAAELGAAAEAGPGWVVTSQRLAGHGPETGGAQSHGQGAVGGSGGAAEASAVSAGNSAAGAGQGQSAASAAPAAVDRELYDAVVVCNGHYSEPRLPYVRGMSRDVGGRSDGAFPGQQLHSHNYRSAGEWRGKVVLVVGASNSGEDISRELSAGGAARVLLSAWSWKNDAWGADAAPYGPGGNIYRFPMVSELHTDGSATFADGRVEGPIDAVIYCTGYRYSFPFLRGAAAAAARVEDNCVGPLWLHMLPPDPRLAPGLSFVGLPWKVVPFPQFQLQSKLIARLLSGRVQLPSREQMDADIAAHFEAMQTQGLPMRYVHMQGQQQFTYNDLLVRLCGPDVAPLPRWRAELNRIIGAYKRERPEDYRDVNLATTSPDAAAALAAAAEDVAKQVELITGHRSGRLCASGEHVGVEATFGASPGTVSPGRSYLPRSLPAKKTSHHLQAGHLAQLGRY